MRNLVAIPTVAITCVLAAQTAPGPSLAEQFNHQADAVTRLLNDHKLAEALTQVTAAVPAAAPAFDAKNPAAIMTSLDNCKGYLGLLQLQAMVIREQGQWEKALGIQQQRVELAKAGKANLAKALETMDKDWDKIVVEGQAYLGTNKPEVERLTKSLETLQSDLKAFNEHQVKLDQKQFEALKERAAQGNKDQMTLQEMQGKIQAYENAMANQKKYAAWAEKARPEGEALVKAAEAVLETNQTTLKGLNGESSSWIAKENAKKGKKKVTMADWVDAVMRDHTNLTKLDSPRVQVAYLNRLLVMAPGNKMATKALDNVLAHKDPFAVEKAGKGRKK